MVKATPAQTGPHILTVLEVLGLIPPSNLGLLLLPNKLHQRHHLSGRAPHAPVGRRRSLEEAAKILRTTVSKIRRLLKIART